MSWSFAESFVDEDDDSTNPLTPWAWAPEKCHDFQYGSASYSQAVDASKHDINKNAGVGQNQGILPASGPSLAPGVMAPQQHHTMGGQPAVGQHHSRLPVVPMNATSRPGAGGSSRYITTVARNFAVPSLEAPGLACTDPACSCGKVPWPTSGELTIPKCGIVCEVCGLYRDDFGINASNLRRHVRDHHLLASNVKVAHGQPHPARLYEAVKKAKQ